MHSIPEVIDDLRQGKMIIMMDDERRENEGDLIMLAEKLSADDINFMITHGRGLFCLPLAASLCQKVGITPMVQQNRCQFGTNFTVSIEAATGVHTGISTADRLRTVQAAIADNAKPSDIVSPGHVFPIMAEENGVLARPGHTEAACDLAVLAGYKPAAVLIEILNPDGTMARRPELEQFAAKYQLKLATVADLVTYRQQQVKI